MASNSSSARLPLAAKANSALLVIDMQVYFFQKPERRTGLDAVLANINRLIDQFDAAGQPVFHVYSAHNPDRSDWDLRMLASGKPSLLEGAPETSIILDLRTRPQHHWLRKTRHSAFFGTNLTNQLSALNIQRVMCVGSYTHYCVNATVFDAYYHNFVPALVTDAVLSHFPEESVLMIERMRRMGFHLYTTSSWLAENP